MIKKQKRLNKSYYNLRANSQFQRPNFPCVRLSTSSQINTPLCLKRDNSRCLGEIILRRLDVFAWSKTKQVKECGSASLPHSLHIGRQCRPLGTFRAFIKKHCLWVVLLELGKCVGLYTKNPTFLVGLSVGRKYLIFKKDVS